MLAVKIELKGWRAVMPGPLHDILPIRHPTLSIVLDFLWMRELDDVAPHPAEVVFLYSVTHIVGFSVRPEYFCKVRLSHVAGFSLSLVRNVPQY